MGLVRAPLVRPATLVLAHLRLCCQFELGANAADDGGCRRKEAELSAAKLVTVIFDGQPKHDNSKSVETDIKFKKAIFWQ